MTSKIIFTPRILSEVQNSISKFDISCIENATIEELQEKIGKLILTYSSKCYNINPGGVILRGRINNLNDLFTTTEQLWYPPSDKIDKIGRCNNIGQSLFYCSIDPKTILRELRPEKNNWITILECSTPNRAWSSLMPIGILALKNINNDLYTIFANHFNTSFLISENDKKINLLLETFLTDIFQKKEREFYKLTVAISNILLIDKKVNGIIYPSIASNFDGLNFVLRPHFADLNITPYHAAVYQIVERTGSRYFLKRIYNSSFLNSHNLFEWIKIPDNNIPPAEYLI